MSFVNPTSEEAATIVVQLKSSIAVGERPDG
jgi:hypothetical protein